MSLVATTRLSGYLFLFNMLSMLVIVMRCCSTCLANVTSPTNDMDKKYTAAHIGGDLVMVTKSYVHINHLMVIASACHM
jgi:hypothetical protein